MRDCSQLCEEMPRNVAEHSSMKRQSSEHKILMFIFMAVGHIILPIDVQIQLLVRKSSGSSVLHLLGPGVML